MSALVTAFGVTAVDPQDAALAARFVERHCGMACHDPSWLADRAVDVVAALDYLIILLRTPTAGDEALDRLTRRRLDARAAAVREGTRLLTMLPAGLVIVTGPPGVGPALGGGGDR